MNEAIDAAIVVLVKRFHGNIKSEDAIRFSQAALNLAHVRGTLMSVTSEMNRIKMMQRDRARARSVDVENGV